MSDDKPELTTVTIENGKYTFISGPLFLKCLRFGDDWVTFPTLGNGMKALIGLVHEAAKFKAQVEHLTRIHQAIVHWCHQSPQSDGEANALDELLIEMSKYETWADGAGVKFKKVTWGIAGTRNT